MIVAVPRRRRGPAYISPLPRHPEGAPTSLPSRPATRNPGPLSLRAHPLRAHPDTCLWFNEGFVTTEVAEAKDLETWLEVGSWSWTWMEPPLGQISFFLLCLQVLVCGTSVWY